MKCPMCGGLNAHRLISDYITGFYYSGTRSTFPLTIPKVPVLVCLTCKAEVLEGKGNYMVDQATKMARQEISRALGWYDEGHK